ncbi:hypothetical protein cyc_06233 [Cyclospora cayetanensis]|uniref:Uncharacterized protein n=1 Tax=Cyclospora cayetanensis TaxID=88456 RepID=A0A1D3CT76_9EIME|nr:hypothetical protein cyc_06233 [Cyclospora cayetanensis]
MQGNCGEPYEGLRGQGLLRYSEVSTVVRLLGPPEPGGSEGVYGEAGDPKDAPMRPQICSEVEGSVRYQCGRLGDGAVVLGSLRLRKTGSATSRQYVCLRA